MTPHLFSSIVYPGKWACVGKRLSDDPSRKYDAVPDAAIIYGSTPKDAYDRWVEYNKRMNCIELTAENLT